MASLVLVLSGAWGVVACISSGDAPPAPSTSEPDDGGSNGNDDAAVQPGADASLDASDAPDTSSGEDAGGTSDAGELDAGPSTFCKTRFPTPSTNVFCEDFDTPGFASRFTGQDVAAGGSLDLTADICKSEPNALVPKNATVFWKSPKSGLSLSKIQFEFELNAVNPSGVYSGSGNMVIAKMSTSGGQVQVEFGYGHDFAPFGGPGSTGYYVFVQNDSGGAPAPSLLNITATPKANDWTNVRFVWGSNNFEVFFDGQSVGKSSTVPLGGTELTAAIGSVSYGVVMSPLKGIDNVQAIVTRAQ